MSRSMSWLMVAKMPLLISSRITSAGLTPRSSASSLTVIVDGSSIAPRSRGSATWTARRRNPPSRRGGLRGPRRPRVPLLLLATLASSVGRRRRCAGAAWAAADGCFGRVRTGGEDRSQRRPGWVRRALDRACLGACRPSSMPHRGTGMHRVRSRGRSGSMITRPSGRPHDPDEVALLPCRPAGHAAPGGDPCAMRPRRPVAVRAERCPAYDDTSSSAAFFRLRFAGAGAAATGSRRAAASGASGVGCRGRRVGARRRGRRGLRGSASRVRPAATRLGRITGRPPSVDRGGVRHGGTGVAGPLGPRGRLDRLGRRLVGCPRRCGHPSLHRRPPRLRGPSRPARRRCGCRSASR